MHDNSKGDVYDYDELYRLNNVKFNVPDPTIETLTEFEKENAFNFDKLDNILRIVENFNGQTKTITTEIPENSKYSKLNQFASFDQCGLSYDLNGNTTQKGTQHFVYDYRNQLLRVTDGSTITENKYDALGRRLQKIVTNGTQSKTENFYYSGQQVIEGRDGNDQVKRQFIYGNGIDEVIRMDAYNGSTITPYYFHRNEIGSTTAVTDANGNVVERYRYGLFGMPTFMDAAGNVIPKSSIGNNILFHGREYEPETNFYYFRARHLDPIMGRFLQTDPMGYEDSLNLYQAFGMNPVNFVDPFGREEDWINKPYYKLTPEEKKKADALDEFCNGINENKDLLLILTLVATEISATRNYSSSSRVAVASDAEQIYVARTLLYEREMALAENEITPVVRTVITAEREIAPVLTETSSALVKYDTYWSNTPKVLDYRPTRSGYTAVTSEAYQYDIINPEISGNFAGKYRGGPHSEMKLPIGDGLDSHHMPADAVSPIPREQGPAIKMDPWDHIHTSSNGRQGLAGAEYRAEIQELIQQGRMRGAMAKEIFDVRKAAEIGSGVLTKYNQAIQEMLEYARLLGLLNK